jgi:hypothetical protein
VRRSPTPLFLAACLGVVACGGSGETAAEAPGVRARQAIQGGTIDLGDPAVVAIVIDLGAGGGLALCTGALIAPNLVLTANHCVSQTASSTGCSPSSFGARHAASAFRVTSSVDAAANAYATGSLPAIDTGDAGDTGDTGGAATWFGAAKVTVAGGDLCGQDMAVLELSRPMIGICPLVPRVDSAVGSGEGYTAIGFGTTGPTAAAAGTRYKATGLSVQCAADCGVDTSSTLEWIGGGAAAKGACGGDSGGPALDATGRVVGTVSRGPASSCSQTVYEGTFGAAAWLKQVALQAAIDGGYSAAGWVTGGATADPDNGYCGAGIDGGVADAGVGDGEAPDGERSGSPATEADAGGPAGVDSGAFGGHDEGEANAATCAVVGNVGGLAPSGAAPGLSALALVIGARARRRRARLDFAPAARGTDSR